MGGKHRQQSETFKVGIYKILQLLRIYKYIHFFYFFFPSLVDHDRPLSKAGLDDAIKVSQKLQQLGWIPQLILSRFKYLN